MHNPIVAPISSTAREVTIYSEGEGASPVVMSEHQTSIYMNDRVAREFRTFRAAVKVSGAVTDVLGLYQERKIHFFMLAQFATRIFDISPSRAENERDFFLASVFTGSNRARMLVETL